MSPKTRQWNQEEKELIRREYRGTPESKQRLIQLLNTTPDALDHQIALLGLSHPQNHRPWTPQDDRTLEDMLRKTTPIQAAKALRRSINTVNARIRYLDTIRRPRDGDYTVTELTTILGKPETWVQRRIDDGLLKAHPSPDGQPVVPERRLRAFVRRYPHDLQGANFDLTALARILAKVPPEPKAPAHDHEAPLS